MSTEPPKSFSQLWRKTIVNAHPKMKHHARLTIKHVRKFRRHAYRFAIGLLDLHKYYHNELMAMIKRKGTTLTSWQDDYFAPIEAMGETRNRLFAAIEAGVSEREYVDRDIVVIGTKIAKTAVRTIVGDGKIPKLVGKRTFEAVEDRCQSLESVNVGLRDVNQTLSQQVEDFRAEIVMLNKRIERMGKEITRLMKEFQSYGAGRTVKTARLTADG